MRSGSGIDGHNRGGDHGLDFASKGAMIAIGPRGDLPLSAVRWGSSFIIESSWSSFINRLMRIVLRWVHVSPSLLWSHGVISCVQWRSHTLDVSTRCLWSRKIATVHLRFDEDLIKSMIHHDQIAMEIGRFRCLHVSSGKPLDRVHLRVNSCTCLFDDRMDSGPRDLCRRDRIQCLPCVHVACKR